MLGSLQLQHPYNIHFKSCMMHRKMVCIQACQRHNTMYSPAAPPCPPAPPPPLLYRFRPRRSSDNMIMCFCSVMHHSMPLVVLAPAMKKKKKGFTSVKVKFYDFYFTHVILCSHCGCCHITITNLNLLIGIVLRCRLQQCGDSSCDSSCTGSFGKAFASVSSIPLPPLRGHFDVVCNSLWPFRQPKHKGSAAVCR